MDNKAANEIEITNENSDEKDISESVFTTWVNEPKLTDLKQDYEDARSSHTAHVSKVNTWLDNLNITGKAKIAKRTGRSSIVPKLIRKQAEWRYASLSEPFLSTDDIFNTEPITAEDKNAAIQNGLVLNNQFNTKIQKIKFIDEYIRTAVDEGTVVVRVGWDYQEEVNEVEVPVFKVVPIKNPILAQEMLNVGQDPVEKIQVGIKLEDKIKVLRNCPTVDICDYNNLIIDPTCEGDLEKAKFIIYGFETSLADLEKEGKYKNLDKININNSSILAEADFESKDTSSFNFKDEPRKKIVAYEYWGYWDINKDGLVKSFVATWVGDTMIRLEENPFPDEKLPFISAQYLPVRKNIYGEPDGELLEDNQKVVGAVTRGMIDIMGRSANGQMAIRKDALDVTNKRKFDNGLDYEFNANVDPRQAFYMHTFPEIPRSAEFMLNQQTAEADSMSGIKSFSSGITGQALGATATGVRSALDATSKRELGILRRMAEGIKQIGRKIVSMNAVFLSEEEVIRITNEEFVTVRRDDLEGNFDLNLTISTAEADNEKASELSFMLQTMGNNQDPGITKLIQVDIARLRKMPVLAAKLEAYEPQPDPIAQEKAMLEVELLKAQIFNEQAKGMENQVDVGLKTAKTQTELAKGRNLNSKSDKQDLDFLDQESGSAQRNDMEKKEFDRAAQLDLKAADKLLAENEKGVENTL